MQTNAAIKYACIPAYLHTCILVYRGATRLISALNPDTPHKCNRTLTSLSLRNTNITSVGGKVRGSHV